MNIKELHKALGTSNKPYKDECGDWNINSGKAKIYLDHIYWYIMVSGKWNSVKKRLSFMTLWQDGDHGGVMRLDRLPTDKEAEIVRKVGAFSKKKTLSPEHRAKLVEAGRLYRLAQGANGQL